MWCDVGCNVVHRIVCHMHVLCMCICTRVYAGLVCAPRVCTPLVRGVYVRPVWAGVRLTRVLACAAHPGVNLLPNIPSDGKTGYCIGFGKMCINYFNT